MTDRPILFSAPMVRALLAGTKTQTRRIIKPRKHASLFNGTWTDSYVLDPGNESWRQEEIPNKVGDRLWVKETWRPFPVDLSPWDMEVAYFADGERRIIKDGEFGESDWSMPKAAARGNVTPLFMPRWASRLTLTVTDVRVDRLQDISEEDAIAEGCGQYASSTKLSRPFNPEWKGIYREGYAELWNEINGAGAWEANPWVCVISFTVHRCNIDEMEKEAA